MALPQGWATAPLETMLDYEQPQKYIVESTAYSETYPTPVLTAGKSFIIGHTDETDGIYSEGLPVIIFDDFTTSSQFVTFPFKVKSSAMKMLQAALPELDIKYLFYRMQLIHHNATTHKRYWISDYSKITIEVAPLAEQHRIVAKIDALFSELDKGVEVMQTVRQQLRTYRQAVLKWAFEGKLTEEWRNENLTAETLSNELDKIRRDTVIENVDGAETHLYISGLWRWLSIGDLFSVEVGATPSRKQLGYWGGNINWVSSGEVKFNRIFATEETITEEGLQHTSTNVHSIGTILLAMIGEGKTRGRAAILKVPAAHNQNTAAIIVGNRLSSEYLYYYLQYNYQNTRRVGSGNNQKALNKERVRHLPFPYTVETEQDLIVAEIESRLSVCDKLEQIVDENLAKAQALRQSILKKAFAGELVPQDPNDEPAEKLLERIKAARATAATQTTSARRKRK